MRQFNLKYRLYPYFAGATVIAVILSGKFEFLLLGLPFLVSMILPALRDEDALYTVACDVSTTRCFEGDTVTASMTIVAETDLPLLEIRFPIFFNGRCIETQTRLVSTTAGSTETVDLEIPLKRRGTYVIGRVTTRVIDTTGNKWLSPKQLPGTTIRCYPTVSRVDLRKGLVFKVGMYTGNYLSKLPGEGIDIAQIREYRQGDPTRHINWKASLKWGNLHINERIQERNTDVVLVVDTLRNVGQWPYTSLECSTRGAASIAQYFLQRKDRVGLIEYGGVANWIRPASGNRQWYRILDKLAQIDESRSLAMREIRTIPMQVLPPGALIIVFTTLLDYRSSRVLAALASRGFQPIALYVSPVELTKDLVGQTDVDKLAQRWWAVEQRDKIRDLQHSGFTVVTWDGKSPVETAINQMAANAQRRWQGSSGTGGAR